MKKVFLTVSCGFLLTVSASPWELNPVQWKEDGTRIHSRGTGDGFLASDACTLFRHVTIRAHVTPQKARVPSWATLGVAVRQDDQNFWHLALVLSPEKNGRRALFELCEMREGKWLSQFEDRLPLHDAVAPDQTWRFGETYELELHFSPEEVRGTVRDAAGKTCFDRTFQTKDRPAVSAGAPALHRTGAFNGLFDQIQTVKENPVTVQKKEATFPAYVSDSYIHHVTGTRTGFFHTQQIEGRWWVIDPYGRGYVAIGCDHISYWGCTSRRTPHRRHQEANRRLYKDKAEWEETTLQRLRAWGFNQLGAGGDPALYRRGLSHTIFLSMGDSLCWDPEDDSYYILKNEQRPCSAFPNVFHPDFPRWCETVARKKCAPMRDDPWLYGYYLDNEFSWWGRGESATGLYEEVLKLRADHTARQALEAFTSARVPGGSAALAKQPAEVQYTVKRDFLKECAERYFSSCAAAIRKYDPNHMILGARFAGLNGADAVVWEVAGRYTDIVTFNCYPWCDFNREAIYEHGGRDARLLQDAFQARYALAKKPMQVTEWSFPALDTGRPCLHGAGQRVPTQKERVFATELCARTMLAMPFLVGYDYFMWADQPAEGMSDAFPEDTNYGLLSIDAVPHEGITSMFARFHQDLSKWCRAPGPRPKPVRQGTFLTVDEAWQAARNGSVRATFAHEKEQYRVTTTDGLTVTGKDGGRDFFETITLNGLAFGSAYAMLSLRQENGSTAWVRTDRVKSVSWDAQTQRLLLTAEGHLTKTRRFELTAAFRFTPEGFLFDVTDVTNTGTADLEVKGIYLSVNSPFARETQEARRPRPPNRWKRDCETGWCAKDGRFTDVTSRSGATWYFNYSVSQQGVHPDATFFWPGANTSQFAKLAAGSRKTLDGHIWARFQFGQDAFRTGSIQTWIDETAKKGGGRVVVPPGTWDVGPLHLRSNVELHLSDETVVRFSSRPEDYLPKVWTSWQGEEMKNLSPLIYAYNVTNVAITGKGVLMTENRPWQEWFKQKRPYRRPQFIQFFGCKNVRLEDFTLRGSPFWTIHLYRTEDALVKNLDVSAFDPLGFAMKNSDGIDVECSRRVKVVGCSFTQGDDAIVLKSGRDLDGIRRGISTEDVLVEDCVVPEGHVLFAIGSEVGGGIRNVTMRNCRVKGAVDRLLFVKTNAKRGGFIENVLIENIEADKVRVGVVNLMADYWYLPKPGAKNLRRTPIRGVTARNIRVDEAAYALALRGDPALPARDITVENIQIGKVRQDVIKAENVENLKVSGLVVRQPPVVPFKKHDEPSRGGQEPD